MGKYALFMIEGLKIEYCIADLECVSIKLCVFDGDAVGHVVSTAFSFILLYECVIRK